MIAIMLSATPRQKTLFLKVVYSAGPNKKLYRSRTKAAGGIVFLLGIGAYPVIIGFSLMLPMLSVGVLRAKRQLIFLIYNASLNASTKPGAAFHSWLLHRFWCSIRP